MKWQQYSSGTERIVYIDASENRLLKVSRDTKEFDADSIYRENVTALFVRFYITRMLHLLYPDFIPNLYCVAETSKLHGLDGTRTVEVSQAIEISEDEEVIKRLYEQYRLLKPEEVVDARRIEDDKIARIKRHANYGLQQRLQGLGIIFDIASAQNYLFSTNGNLYYVDRLEIDPEALSESVTVIEDLITQSKITEKQKQKARTLLKRALHHTGF